MLRWTVTILTILFSARKKSLLLRDKAWPLYFLIDKEGKDFLLFFNNDMADFV